MKTTSRNKYIFLSIILTIISLGSSYSQIKPMIVDCPVYSISPTELTVGSGAGLVYPIVNVSTLNNCTGYKVSEDYTWLSYTKTGLTVRITVQANNGPARTGYVSIGSKTLFVYQACGNFPGAAGSITGSDNVCPGQTGVTYSVSPIANATGYQWSVPSGATIVSGFNTNSITVNYATNASSGEMSVYGTSSCGNGTPSAPRFHVNVRSISDAGSISGATSVCAGNTYTYSVSPVSGASYYVWTLPSGASGSSSSNSIDVSFIASGTISVTAVNSYGCVSSPSSLFVNYSTLANFSVSGNASICPGSSTSIYLSGSESGITYNLYRNGTLYTSLTGTGSLLTFSGISSDGTYTVKGISPAGCEIQMSGSAVVTVISQSTPASSISSSQGTTVCPNTSTQLSVVGGSLEPGVASWKWYSGSCGGTYLSSGSSLTVNPTATTIYFVRAEGGCTTTSCAQITINVIPPPLITQQPTGVTVCNGASTGFSIAASGAVSYQWQNYVSGSWSDIPGATSASYSFTASSGMNGTAFRCIVIGQCSLTAISSSATLSISTLTSFSISGGGSICPGNSSAVSLSGSESGITYNLYRDGTLHTSLTGTGSVLTFSNLSSAGTYTIRGYTSMGCEVQMNGSATINVKSPSTPASSILVSPGATICPGTSVQLSVSGGSLEPGLASWKWYSGSCGGTSIGSGSSLTVSPASTTTYFVRAEGGCVTTSCTSVVITVLSYPSIVTQPVSSTVVLNNNATFTVSATGPNLQYQWQSSALTEGPWTDLTGSPATGYNTPTLTILGSSSFNNNYYRCRIISTCQTIYSNTVKLTTIFPNAEYLTGEDIQDPETRTLDTTLLVGTTNGNLGVNPMGGSSYALPLDLPVGVNGLIPEISLTYNSSSGPGILGYGWQIGGISTITRGPQTYYFDGVTRGIELDSFDRFYLDGQRLVNTSFTYGDPNASYQTDNDIYTRISPQSSTSDGPGWFKAETKSGLKFEYGNSFESKQTIPGGSKVLVWHVSRISDLFGNQINFEYLNDNQSVYLSKVSYGPNEITFFYKGRTDNTISYFKGAKFEQNGLLEKIVIKYNSNIIKTYLFKQSLASTFYDDYSLLNEIIEYGLGTDHYNSTVFHYQLPENINFSQTLYNQEHPYINYKSKLINGDFNGDGRTDFLCLPDVSKGAAWTGIRVCLSTGSDSFDSIFSSNTSINMSGLKDIRALDINGDGIDDVLYEYGLYETSGYYYMLSNGNALTSPVYITSMYNNQYTGLTGKAWRNIYIQGDDNEKIPLAEYLGHLAIGSTGADFNGDGRNDVFLNDPDGDWKIFTYADSTNQMYQIASGSITTLSNDVLTGDFNGDGKSDIWSFENTGLKIYSLAGSSINQIYYSTWPTKSHFFNLGDFNGDGKIDIFLYGYGKNESTEYDWPKWQIRLSNGVDFELKEINQKKANLKDDNVRLSDFNGDGVTDIMVNSLDQSWTGTYFYMTKNDGADFYTHNLPSYPSSTHNYFLGDFNGDSQCDFICTDGISPWWDGYQIYRTSGNTNILLDRVSNGLGQLSKISYSKLSSGSSSVYRKGSGAAFPVLDFQGQWTVVNSMQTENARGTMNTVNYYYEGAKINVQGKGFLGFSKTSITDQTNELISENFTTFDPVYYYPNYNFSYSKIIGASDSISKTISLRNHLLLDYATKRILPYVYYTSQTDKLRNQVISTSSQYDTYGNPTSITADYHNGRSETTTFIYDNIINSSKWLIGRPVTSSIQYVGNDTTITKSIIRVFSSDNNNLISETGNQGTSFQIVDSYDYYPNGTLQRKIASSGNISREASYSYEPDNIRIHSSTDQFGHSEIRAYDNYGRLLSITDYLGNVVSYQYDNMHRPVILSSSDGNETVTSYAWQNPAGSPKLAQYSITETSNDGSQKVSWFNKWGMKVRNDIKGFDGLFIYVDTRYNHKGQVDSISDPYFQNGSPLWTKYFYDAYGRQTNVSRPTGRNTSFTYSSNSTTETTAGKSFSKTFDSDGSMISVSDAGGTIFYSYYPDGKPETITAPGGIITRFKYDVAGNKRQIIDPSAGTISYTYNAFGELVSQTSSRGQVTNFAYTDDGRVSQRTSPEGTTTYNYNGNKQIESIIAPGNISTSFSYYSQGRPYTKTVSIPGSSTFTTTFSYDSLGRTESVNHPSGITESYSYNSSGYLSSIAAGGETRWTITGMNARQQITSGIYGSSLNLNLGYDNYGYPTSTVTGNMQNYSYNFNIITGNLNWRQNNNYGNLKEDFQYDNLDRLDNVQKGSTLTLDMAYDGNSGGITNKSDMGSYLYNVSGKPYAVGEINPTSSFTLRNNQLIEYTSFESVHNITSSDTTALFYYDAGNERAKMVVQDGGTEILTRWYPFDSYIKETAGGVTKGYTFIGGDAYSAPVVAVTQDGSTAYYYLLRDYLGNITHIVNTSNSVIAEYSYDAWGRLRNPTDWTPIDPLNEPFLLIAGRGFTSHEHLPWFNLINMNGRLYDPLIGMFLSPDNYIQNPDYTQNFNRYSYCLNNPLIYTDPSGEFWHLIIGAGIGGIINWASHGADFTWEGLGYFRVGAAAGAVGAGVGAGVSSAMAGGSFGAGFIGSSAGKAVTSSFVSGAAIGASSGFSSGFITGTGNGLLGEQSFGQALVSGTKYGLVGGVSGGALGGMIGGIDAAIHGRGFWDGFDYQNALDNAVAREGLQNPNSKWLAANRRNGRYIRETYNLDYPQVSGNKIYFSADEYSNYGANWGNTKGNITLISKSSLRDLNSYGIDVLRHEGTHQLQMLSGLGKTLGIRQLEIGAYMTNLLRPATFNTINRTVNILINDWAVSESALYEILINFYNGGAIF